MKTIVKSKVLLPGIVSVLCLFLQTIFHRFFCGLWPDLVFVTASIHMAAFSLLLSKLYCLPMLAVSMMLLLLGLSAQIACLPLCLCLLAELMGRAVRLAVNAEPEDILNMAQTYLAAFALLLLCTVSDAVSGRKLPELLMLLSAVFMYVLLLVSSAQKSLFIISRARRKKIISSHEATKLAIRQEYHEAEFENMKRVFRRVEEIMQEGKPYLNESYRLETLAAEVYTNKSYLSKSINMMTGQNFCQFINTYRVRYSKELMAANKDLRISEISAMSGFHSSVSFGMAFKLNFGETPREYLQKLRAGLE